MKKLSIVELRNQLAELKKAETVAQTREQLLAEEKQVLLAEIQSVLLEVEKLGILPKADLNAQNLTNVVAGLYAHIESEIAASQVPAELL